MSLISYNSQLEIEPTGFINLGTTCYFNALLQSMLSCTSLIDVLTTKKYVSNAINAQPTSVDVCLVNNPAESNNITNLIIKYIELNRTLKQANSVTDIQDQKIIKDELSNYAPLIWKQMIKKLSNDKKIPIQSFMQGQQCAGEGFHYLLESMEEFPLIQKLFMHRYKSLIHCSNCNKWISEVECLYSLFDVESNLNSEQIKKFDKYHIKSENMNEFILKQSSYVEGFKCTKCNDTDDKFRINVLVMVPEILTVMAKKYTLEEKLDIYTEFPETLKFNGNDSDMIYEAVSQIEHVGGKNGGHYWAIVKRKGGWFNVNDMSISPSKFQPTKNTYIVFYHLKKK
jgi:ubiquitin C-terminal hydrolase